MKFIEIKKNCYYFNSAVNIGYIVSESRKQGMLIDAGLESSAAKKAIQLLQKHDLPITHLMITHAHADHFGGAQYIQKNYDVHTIAPSLEEAIMRYPILEPIYLFYGNFPMKEMRNKFLEAPSIFIDEICEAGNWAGWDGQWCIEFIPLPGHSHNQFGLLYNDILYAADAYLGMEVLKKHSIPFIVDAGSNLSTLHYLLNLEVKGMLPGHGTFESAFQETVQANIDVHQRLASHVYNMILVRGDRGISVEELVAKMLIKHEIEPANFGVYSLFRTAITAYLIQFIEEGRAVYTIHEGRPVIFSGQSSA
ncbi:MBL fold metallo-hydrolase [Fictibacillus nanhaiensis]|uniref:MBL fold metallo-hydrolase n=1 Tax=Fictibacillus nanhaiensis TaxID=742169 RepID=UPI001C9529C0|nr:MBL fold metallo-hydrolase [Fictibacillus nanhaiensis]MBY6036281.1 MBL fold metallo-hydrolase [Fictibacillus nanhaiensis]